MLSWHAYYYDHLAGSVAPVESDWIDADNVGEAIAIVREHLGHHCRAELIRPSWEEQTPRVVVTHSTRRAAPHSVQ